MKLIRDSITPSLCLLLALAVAPTTLAKDPLGFLVVVHQSNTTGAVTKKQLSKILLKKISRWQGDLEIQPVDQDVASPVRRSFTTAIHGRSVTSIKNYWQRQIFSGLEALPPPELRSDQEVLEYVRRNSGAVGYVSSEARLEGDVKVLKISDLPDDD